MIAQKHVEYFGLFAQIHHNISHQHFPGLHCGSQRLEGWPGASGRCAGVLLLTIPHPGDRFVRRRDRHLEHQFRNGVTPDEPTQPGKATPCYEERCKNSCIELSTMITRMSSICAMKDNSPRVIVLLLRSIFTCLAFYFHQERVF